MLEQELAQAIDSWQPPTDHLAPTMTESVVPQDGQALGEAATEAGPVAQVLIDGDKLFHVQSYDIGGGQRRYDAIWTPGNDGRPIVWGWTRADLEKRNGELWAQGFRLTHQQAYDIGGGQIRYDAIWTPGNDGRPVVWGWTLADFQNRIAELRKQGFRLSHQDSYAVGGGQRLYNGIWTPGNDDRPVAWGWALPDLQKENAKHYANGYRLAHQQSYDIGNGQRRYDAIWAPGTDGRGIVWGWTLEDFQVRLGELYNKRIAIGKQALSLPKLLNGIRKALDGRSVGYGVVISYGGNLEFRHDAGLSRTASDAPQQDFSAFRRTNLASVSKPLTAMGVIKALTANKLTIDDTFARFLPSDWTRGPNIATLTFKQLLTHTSGIRNPKALGLDYAALKQLIADGVGADRTQQYQNHNFALFRIILPYMTGFKESSVTVDARPLALSKAFLTYMNANVFKPAGLKTVSSKPDAVNSTLFYPFPAGSIHGWDFGDDVAVLGGQGFQVSMDELATLFQAWRYSTKVLTDAQRQLMMDHHLGLFRVSVKDGTALQHGGYLWFPTNNGTASLNCSITDFSLGVQVALIHNSPVVPAPPGDIVTSAFNAAWEPR